MFPQDAQRNQIARHQQFVAIRQRRQSVLQTRLIRCHGRCTHELAVLVRHRRHVSALQRVHVESEGIALLNLLVGKQPAVQRLLPLLDDGNDGQLHELGNFLLGRGKTGRCRISQHPGRHVIHACHLALGNIVHVEDLRVHNAAADLVGGDAAVQRDDVPARCLVRLYKVRGITVAPLLVQICRKGQHDAVLDASQLLHTDLPDLVVVVQRPAQHLNGADSGDSVRGHVVQHDHLRVAAMQSWHMW